MSVSENGEEPPLFNAVSSSARQLFILLRCISFAQKSRVVISEEGLRFSVEESSVMEGHAFLDKHLFTTFQFRSPPVPDDTNSIDTPDPDTIHNPTFEISLPSLLETLQIFGLTDPNKPFSNRSDNYTSLHNPTSAFSTHLLGTPGLCRLTYPSLGSPLQIILSEPGVTTTCALTTYEPTHATDIPFHRSALHLKIIMRASHLLDAITELGSTNPHRLTIRASPASTSPTQSNQQPNFMLSSTGPLGSASVSFSASTAATTASGGVLETFQVPRRVAHSYRFADIAKARRAMGVATKVSIRGDAQGVLSLQFMIEVEGVGERKASFVDFRVVPLVREGGEEEDGEEEDGDGDGEIESRDSE